MRGSAHRAADRGGEGAADHCAAHRLSFPSALRGTTYKEYTLIGGPRLAEQFVLRDDAFDCVTFCETVLAAAIAHDIAEFEQVLRNIRYHNGVVTWRERNHYYLRVGPAQYREQNLPLPRHGRLGRHQQDGLLASRAWAADIRHDASSRAPPSWPTARQLAIGDIVGFVTHAAESGLFPLRLCRLRREGANCCCGTPSKASIACSTSAWTASSRVNRVRYVTLLRPQEAVGARLISVIVPRRRTIECPSSDARFDAG